MISVFLQALLSVQPFLFGQPPGQPAGHLVYGKDFNVGHYMQTFQPNFFIPAMFVGTMDSTMFIPVTMILPGGHKDSAKQNALASFSHYTLFK